MNYNNRQNIFLFLKVLTVAISIFYLLHRF